MVTGGKWENQDVVFKRNVKSNRMSSRFLANEISVLQYIQKTIDKSDRNTIMHLLHISHSLPQSFELTLERAHSDVFNFERKLHAHQRYDFTHRAMRRILHIVQTLHAIHVAHNDIKPENMVIRDITEPAESIAFIDFGVSCVVEPFQTHHLHLEATEPHNQRFWLENIEFGTRGFRHPNLLERKQTNLFACDLYACGIVCFVLFAGTMPYEDDDDVLCHESQLATYKSFIDKTWRWRNVFPQHVSQHPNFNMWADFIDELCSGTHTTVTEKLMTHPFLQTP